MTIFVMELVPDGLINRENPTAAFSLEPPLLGFRSLLHSPGIFDHPKRYASGSQRFSYFTSPIER
jgi:hypothetical protein